MRRCIEHELDGVCVIGLRAKLVAGFLKHFSLALRICKDMLIPAMIGTNIKSALNIIGKGTVRLAFFRLLRLFFFLGAGLCFVSGRFGFYV